MLSQATVYNWKMISERGPCKITLQAMHFEILTYMGF
jgi:hypothetical protein